jgi:prophage antirepressor-like protein
MNEIQIFNSPQFGEIRTATDDNNEPLFCAADVCKALGYVNGRDAISKHVDDPDVAKRDAWVTTGTKADGSEAKRQTLMTFVNESGLYSLIFGSKLESAKQFKRWVTSEVLPEIRKNGGYIRGNVDETPEELMARALAVAKQTLERVERERQQLANTNETQRIQLGIQDAEIRKAAPKVEYYDKVMQSNCTMTTTQIANGLGMPCHRLNKLLRDAGIQYKQSGQLLLRSPYTDFGLHAVRTQTYTHADGSIGTSQYTVWNERGKRFISALVDNNWNVKQAIKVLSDF